NGLTEWIMGDYLPADATLNRFFALHVIALPLVLLLLVVLHLGALHEVGSNNPDGVDIKKGPKGNRWAADKPADGIPFHPYYTVKDLVGVGFFLILAAFIIFFAPTFGGWFLEHDNFTEANRLVTPEHIKPVWYFTPYYAMLRVVPSFFAIKLWGVLVMFGAIVVLFLVPWLDKSPVRSYRYRGKLSWVMLAVFVLSFLWLGKIGAGPGADPVETIIGRVLTFLYFAFFITMPLWTRLDKTRPVPERVTMHEYQAGTLGGGTCNREEPISGNDPRCGGAAGWRAGFVGRGGRRRRCSAPCRRRHRRPGFAAAWRQAVHELLLRLPFAQVRALLAHGRGPRPDRGRGDGQPQLHRREVRRAHQRRDDAGARDEVVRQDAAGPERDLARPRQRLDLHLPHVLLPGRVAPAGLEQHAVPECIDAQPAVGNAGSAAPVLR